MNCSAYYFCLLEVGTASAGGACHRGARRSDLIVEVLGVKADPARRMPRPLPALGGHYQGRDLHPFSVNHAVGCSRKCVVVRMDSLSGRRSACIGQTSSVLLNRSESWDGVLSRSWKIGTIGAGSNSTSFVPASQWKVPGLNHSTGVSATIA